MKYPIFISVLCTLLGFLACKKDAGITAPLGLQDFSGVYSLEGTLEIQSNPIEEVPIQWIVNSTPQDNSYKVGTLGSYSSSAYRWTISGIYRYPGSEQFKLIVYGIPFQSNGPEDDFWSISELDSIFQTGKQLSFGTNFGQVGIEFNPANSVYDEYWTLFANNANNKVTIVEVNDFRDHLPERKWAKQIVVTFEAHLRPYPADGSPNIILKNCRASLLFIPNVQ